VVQRRWPRVQDTLRSYQWHIHWSVPYRAAKFGSNCLADKKCPFTGDVSIRGRILTGKVVSTKMTRTIIIRRDYLHYIPKYSILHIFIFSNVGLIALADRYEKRHKNLAAHVSPAFRVELGDVVTVGTWGVKEFVGVR